MLFVQIFIALIVSTPLSMAEINGVIISDKGGLDDYSEFIIYIKEGNRFPKLTSKKQKIEIGQVNKKFTPSVSAIETGSSVDFKNYDDIFHNVFSLTPGSKFDLGVFKGEQSFKDDLSSTIKKNNQVTFKKQGKVDIFCNIHEDMMTSLYVFDHGYFASINQDGQFQLPTPENGNITIVLDGNRIKKPIAKKFNVKDLPKFLKIKFKSVDMKPIKKHSKKDGTQYKKTQWDIDEDDFY